MTLQHCNVENGLFPLKPIYENFLRNVSLNIFCIIFLIVSAKELLEKRDKVLTYKSSS